MPRRPFPLALYLLGAIILLATALRVFYLDTIPPGLHYDEAFKAVSARGIVQTGQLQVFFTGNFGEEPLHATAGAVWFILVGERVWAIRFTSAVFGILFVPALYFCARVLLRSTRAALSAAFIGATLYWSLNFSRIAIEPITLALLVTLHLGTLWWVLSSASLRRAKIWRWMLAGFFAGAIYYTYLASRITPLVYILFGIYLLIFHRALVRPWRSSLALTLVVALLTVAPLGWFFINNPTAFFARAGQVLTPEQLGSNLVATAQMFFMRGDADPRDNLPGRPALDLLLAIFFVVGVLVSLRRWRQPQYVLLLLWLAIFTAPAVVTEFAPNFRRAIGALPAVIILCALGADWLAARFGTSPHSGDALSLRRPPALVTNSLLALVLLVSAFWSARDYFITWAKDPGLFYSFDTGLLRVAQFLAARPPSEQLCLSPNYVDHPTVLWALNGRAYSTFDGRRVAVLPNSAPPASCAIITYEDKTFDLLNYYPAAQSLETIYDFENRPYAQLFHVPQGTLPVLHPQYPLAAQIGDSIRVLGYDLTRADNRVTLEIYWRVASPVPADYTAFVHLIGPPNPATQSPVWSQDDAQPGHGTYPTSRWRQGETIIDRYELQVPADAPSGTFQIEFGMYSLSTGARLPVMVDGQPVADDHLLSVSIPN